MEVLFSDAHIAIIIKPVGVISQYAPEHSVPEALCKQLRVNSVWPVHRLDKMVGGVMVFALSEAAASALSKAVQEQKLEKTYFAVISGVPVQTEGVLTDLLFHDKGRNKTYVVDRMRKGVKPAKLGYQIREAKVDKSLVHVKLFTGRTHQIRVQFSNRKHPLLGDGRYGEKTKNTQIGLWSYSLRFAHPITGKTMYFCHRPPEQAPWNEFTNEAYEMEMNI